MRKNVKAAEPPRKKSALRELVETVVWALIIALLIRYFVVEGYYIPSGSMKPTLVPGERVLVAKFIYRFTEPTRGDIVVFKYPIDNRKNLIKRIVGLPGEEVEIKDGQVFINGEPLAGEQFARTYYDVGYYGTEKRVIPEGHYFVLGDNSENSDDSRFWGYVPREKILGKAFLVYWPPAQIRILK
ncbi:MAG: signal peptidase [Candidatus Atribacteria bacterium]|nr:signal peptidase [Candidatus Atribacteria bacterium]